jgi:erythromycin esterase-like protein
MPGNGTVLIEALGEAALPLGDQAGDLDGILELIGESKLVLIGEATHGTHDFYRLRAELTRRLIAERGFMGVAAEADWPDAYRTNRFVRGHGTDPDASFALSDFRRFPAWMWRNAEVLDFVGWLRDWNEDRPEDERAGFYGLDLYSLHASMEAVIAFLEQVDPEAARRARARYACFERFSEEAQAYGEATALGLGQSCERQVLAQLLELQVQRRQALQHDGLLAGDEAFAAEQNARLVVNAEQYYREMFIGAVSTWNLRDRHMADTLQALSEHLERRQGSGRLVVWAHNSHLGDARATEMGHHGQLNLGQLARQRFPGATFLIGFTTHSGSVTAAREWGAPAERRRVRPALAGSYEDLFHRLGLAGFWLPLGQLAEAAGGLHEPRLERAIGVLYQPETERHSHYFRASLPYQFDLVLHVDHTRALEPLEYAPAWGPEEQAEAPQTYPTGL